MSKIAVTRCPNCSTFELPKLLSIPTIGKLRCRICGYEGDAHGWAARMCRQKIANLMSVLDVLDGHDISGLRVSPLWEKANPGKLKIIMGMIECREHVQ